jgi:phage shock protein C
MEYPMQAAATFDPQDPAFDRADRNLFLRNDTILGVCQGLGEDFGFNPTYLRLVFAGLFYFSPLWVVGAYVALGLTVALSRWVYPVPEPETRPEIAAQPQSPAANTADPERLAA